MAIDHKKLESSQFLKHVDYHSQLESTNTRAIQIARNASLETPALTVCDLQTKGRGRGANQWQSSEGNLAFSMVVDLQADTRFTNSGESIQRSLLLSPITALAICHALETVHEGDRFEIKWPNDVYVRQRKISGILIETSQRENDQSNSMRFVIGCGINVNVPIVSEANVGEDLKQAISLVDLTESRTDLTGLLLQFVDSFARCLTRLEYGDAKLLEEIRSRFLLTGREILVVQGNRRFEGQCTGLDDNGGLKISTVEGNISIISGTVEAF